MLGTIRVTAVVVQQVPDCLVVIFEPEGLL